MYIIILAVNHVFDKTNSAVNIFIINTREILRKKHDGRKLASKRKTQTRAAKRHMKKDENTNAYAKSV